MRKLVGRILGFVIDTHFHVADGKMRTRFQERALEDF
jgi:hypothetical protein